MNTIPISPRDVVRGTHVLYYKNITVDKEKSTPIKATLSSGVLNVSNTLVCKLKHHSGYIPIDQICLADPSEAYDEIFLCNETESKTVKMFFNAFDGLTLKIDNEKEIQKLNLHVSELLEMHSKLTDFILFNVPSGLLSVFEENMAEGFKKCIKQNILVQMSDFPVMVMNALGKYDNVKSKT